MAKQKQTKTALSNELGVKLKMGYVCDLKKPEIDRIERATIIRSLLDDNGWSIRHLAKELNIPKSTIEDWLLFEQVDAQNYQKLRDTGVGDTEIYRMLRNSKHVPEVKELDPFDYKLHEMIAWLNANMVHPRATTETLGLLKKLRDLTTQMEHAINKEQGKSKVTS